MNEKLLKEIPKIRTALKNNAPLIHCITNPISIHDCANIVLAAGGRPMMAEHPMEVADITVTAAALALNLGNITDARKASLLISGKTAAEHRIPVVMDMVGIGCSPFRREIVMAFLDAQPEQKRLILKGNMSELKALADASEAVSGVDVAPEDIISQDNEEAYIALAKKLAIQYGAVILASGKTDVVTDGVTTFLIDNGHEMMGHVTGTGCMLNVLTASYASSGELLTAAAAACVVLGISGELAAENSRGTGSFQTAFLDALYMLDQETIEKRILVRMI